MRRFKFNMLWICLALVLSLISFNRLNAHDLWINVEDYTPDLGTPLWITLGYGHYYLCPGTEFIEKQYRGKVFLIDPDGRRLKLKAIDSWGYESGALQKKGTYLIATTKKGMFFTKTTEGYKRGRSKKGLKNVISCTYSAKYAKAIVNVGGSGGNIFSKPVGHKLEIIPLKDPANLRQGDYLPIKVIYNNKPLKTEVFATYAGFSSDKSVFAYATRTDERGTAEIKIIRSGIWLVKVGHKVPYPEPDVCDQYSFSATLTFEVK